MGSEMCIRDRVKRFEKPVFKENANGEIEVLRQEIEFTGKKIERH